MIVDDGSTDDTPHILSVYAERRDYIKVIRRPDRGARSVGPGVINAFYTAYDQIDVSQFDFLCKLDLDLELPPRYFEEMIAAMQADPRLASVSGKAYYPAPENTAEDFSGRLISEGIGDEMSVGACKFYRRRAFEQIGGFVREVMWDGIDCHRCRMFGWKTGSFDSSATRFIHLRPMGSSQVSLWEGRQRHGRGQWFMGTALIYMLISSLFRMTKRPFVIGGLGMLWGYLKAMFSGAKQYDEPAFRRFLHRYQLLSLFRGKAEATRRMEAEYAGRWESPPPQSRERIAA